MTIQRLPAPAYLVSHPVFASYVEAEELRNPYFNEFWDEWCVRNNQSKLRATINEQVRGALLEFVLACRGCHVDDRPFRDNIMHGFAEPFDHINGPTDAKTTLVKVSRDALFPYIQARVDYDMWKYSKGGVKTVQYWQSLTSGVTKPWLLFTLAGGQAYAIYEFPK